jgi:hypothetical protein
LLSHDNGIKTNLITSCSAGTLKHNTGPEDDIKELSERDCDSLGYLGYALSLTWVGVL